MSIRTTSTATTTAAIIAVVVGTLMLTSCHKKPSFSADPIAHTASFDIWPDSIDLHSDVILKAESDSLLLVRMNGNTLDSIRVGTLPDDAPTFHSDYPILDLLYRHEASTSPSGQYTPSTPYEIYLNPLHTPQAKELLLSRLRNNLVTPYWGLHLQWPTVNENAEWLLATTELAIATGDAYLMRQASQTATKLLATDRKISFNPAIGLFQGVPRYMARDRGIFPKWMEQPDIFMQSTLAVNVAYIAAMRRLDIPSDSLLQAIKNELWIPNMGYFSATTYGIPSYPIPLQSTDNLAQAIGIISGAIPDTFASTIIKMTPITDHGVELFEPLLPHPSATTYSEIPVQMVRAAWCGAAAAAANETAMADALGALLAGQADAILSGDKKSAFKGAITTLLLRGFLGIRYEEDGFFILPSVPSSLPGSMHIGNLRYREANLDITINGTGRAISTFTIDGTPADPFVPASLKGHHSIAITLAGPSADPGTTTHIDQPQQAPLPPETTWTSSNECSFSATDNDCRLVYINGILQEEIYRNSYRLFNSPGLAVVQFTSFVDNRLSGFSSKPFLYIPPEKRTIIYLPGIATTGTKILEDKTLAAKYVESSRYRNSTIAFDFNAPNDGRYLFDIHYINGLGVVNTQRKLALRQLRADGKEIGIFVLPQLTAADAPSTAQESWQELAAWSNQLIATLPRGTSRIELRYYQPSPVYADPTSNVVLLDQLRIIPID